MGSAAVTLWAESNNGYCVLAETFDDVLGALYPDAFSCWEMPGPQLKALALTAANQTQGLEMLALVDKGLFDPDEEDVEILTALFASRDRPAPVIAWSWERDFPLIITTDSFALRGWPVPVRKNVVVVDSATAETLVGSLVALGVMHVGRL
jgi:hypothetical protein